MAHVLLAALTWDPQVKGALIIFTAVIILPGSVYLLLSTNLGARLGLLVALAGLMGWMTVMGVVWTAYGIGLKGTAPSWKIEKVFRGDPATVNDPELTSFPKDWKPIKLEDPEVAEGQAVADSALAPPSDSGRQGFYANNSEYLPIAGYDRGGETYLFTLKHRPHFLLLQVRGVVPQQTVPGQAAPRPQADPNQPIASVLMVRDLGSLRVPPMRVAFFSLVLFSLLVYVLHTRDKQIMAARGAGKD